MKDRIGVFDSGVGGLTILKALVEKMPEENYYYFGDTANVPYGNRTSEDIGNLSVKAYEKLRKLGIKILIIGCNTATVHGLDRIKEVADIPIIGVIKPGVNAVIESGCENILILATQATIDSGMIQGLLKERNPNINLEGIGAPDIVMAVENGDSKNERGKRTVYSYLEKVSIDPDCVILSCTHFPAIEHFIKEFYNEKGKDITIINPANRCAEISKELLNDLGAFNDGDLKGDIKFFASGDLKKFKESGNLVLDGDLLIEEVENL